MIYFVCEIQNNTMTTYAFVNYADAEEKYYYILQFACKSDVARHGAMIVNNLGEVHASKVYDRTQAEQE